MAEIKLGDKVKDSVSGFTGIAIGKTEWLHGCNRFIVQPEVAKDGKLPDNASFDEPQLILVKAARVKKEVVAKRTGGYDIRITQKDVRGR